MRLGLFRRKSHHSARLTYVFHLIRLRARPLNASSGNALRYLIAPRSVGSSGHPHVKLSCIYDIWSAAASTRLAPSYHPAGTTLGLEDGEVLWSFLSIGTGSRQVASDVGAVAHMIRLHARLVVRS